MKTLMEVYEGNTQMTVLIITHRMHLATSTDKVMYFGKNNILEFGTQNELIQEGQGYAKAWGKYIKSYETIDNITQ